MSAHTAAAALPLLTAAFAASPVAVAQDPAHQGHAHHDHGAMRSAAPAGDTEPVTPVPELTSADREAAFPELTNGMEHPPRQNAFVLIDQFELGDADAGTDLGWKGKAWFGSDLDRVWLRSAGERTDGVTAGSELEVLYGRSIAPWWDVVAGIKHDFKPGASRNWAAIGIEGLLPGRFEASVMAYVAESGHFAASIEVQYDLLITNRLILQPIVGLSHFSKSDPARGVASGLQGIDAGLRLRYEFSRQFAPYVGVTYTRALGNTADLLAADGEGRSETMAVAGIRAWF